MPNTFASFLYAEGTVESGRNYNAVNPSSGALGYWQVMPANVAPWTRESIGYAVSPSTFLNSPWIQVAVANHILGGYYRRYGPAGAAAMWYSGQPNPNDPIGNPTVREYVNRVLALMNIGPVGGNANTQITSYPGSLSDIPIWTDLVRDSSKQLWYGGRNLVLAATGIRKLRSRLG
jgi:Transglycosylase SLT domain